MIKPFLPTCCPECGSPLTIEQGKKSDTIKLVCSRRGECDGAVLKKLQKGIIAFEINGLGPSTIEKLSAAGIESSLDLFDPSKFSEKALCASGEFRKGRLLEKILDAVGKVKEIPIHKAILSLQFKDIGKTFSERIGQIFSGMEPDFSGLQLDVREQLANKDSVLYTSIENSIKKFEEFGVKIVRFEVKKVDPNSIQKVNKVVATTVDATEILNKLSWEVVDVKDHNCQMLIIGDKNETNASVQYAKDNGIKILTMKQVELVFVQ